VKLAAAMVLLNITLNFVLMQFMYHRGLAFSTSITAMVNFTILVLLIKARVPNISFEGIFPNLLKSIIICALLYIGLVMMNRLVPVSSRWASLGRLAGAGGLCFLGFYAMGYLMNLAYLKEAGSSLWNRLRKR
jgi:putative peptidoglycan lipid II flippase